MTVMIDETFVLESSWIHKIHPDLRVISAVLCTTLVAFFYKLTTLSIATTVFVLIALATRLNYRVVARRLILLSGFLLILWIVLPFSYEVEPLNSVGLPKTGVLLALQITLKTVTISFVFMILVSTMSLDTLGCSLSRLCIPHKMIYLLLVTYRYGFLVEREYRKLICAITVRNFHPRTNIHTYKTYSYLVGMLFVRTYERAQRVHKAMICRSFSGEFFTVREDRLNCESVLFIFFTVVLLLILFFLEIKT